MQHRTDVATEHGKRSHVSTKSDVPSPAQAELRRKNSRDTVERVGRGSTNTSSADSMMDNVWTVPADSRSPRSHPFIGIVSGGRRHRNTTETLEAEDVLPAPPTTPDHDTSAPHRQPDSISPAVAHRRLRELRELRTTSRKRMTHSRLQHRSLGARTNHRVIGSMSGKNSTSSSNSSPPKSSASVNVQLPEDLPEVVGQHLVSTVKFKHAHTQTFPLYKDLLLEGIREFLNGANEDYTIVSRPKRRQSKPAIQSRFQSQSELTSPKQLPSSSITSPNSSSVVAVDNEEKQQLQQLQLSSPSQPSSESTPRSKENPLLKKSVAPSVGVELQQQEKMKLQLESARQQIQLLSEATQTYQMRADILTEEIESQRAQLTDRDAKIAYLTDLLRKAEQSLEAASRDDYQLKLQDQVTSLHSEVQHLVSLHKQKDRELQERDRHVQAQNNLIQALRQKEKKYFEREEEIRKLREEVLLHKSHILSPPTAERLKLEAKRRMPSQATQTQSSAMDEAIVLKEKLKLLTDQVKQKDHRILHLEEALDNAIDKHERSIDQLRQFESSLESRIQSSLQQATASLQSSYESQIQLVSISFEKELQKVKQRHNEDCKRLQADHEGTVEHLQWENEVLERTYKSKLKGLKRELEVVGGLHRTDKVLAEEQRALVQRIHSLQDENESLQLQLDALRNEKQQQQQQQSEQLEWEQQGDHHQVKWVVDEIEVEGAVDSSVETLRSVLVEAGSSLLDSPVQPVKTTRFADQLADSQRENDEQQQDDDASTSNVDDDHDDDNTIDDDDDDEHSFDSDEFPFTGRSPVPVPVRRRAGTPSAGLLLKHHTPSTDSTLSRISNYTPTNVNDHEDTSSPALIPESTLMYSSDDIVRQHSHDTDDLASHPRFQLTATHHQQLQGQQQPNHSDTKDDVQETHVQQQQQQLQQQQQQQLPELQQQYEVALSSTRNRILQLQTVIGILGTIIHSTHTESGTMNIVRAAQRLMNHRLVSKGFRKLLSDEGLASLFPKIVGNGGQCDICSHIPQVVFGTLVSGQHLPPLVDTENDEDEDDQHMRFVYRKYDPTYASPSQEHREDTEYLEEL